MSSLMMVVHLLMVCIRHISLVKVAYGVGNPIGHIGVEEDREARKGSGVNYLISRKCFIMHPRGIAWQNAVREHSESVSKAELANPTNWKRVYEPKQIRIVAMKHTL